MPDQKIADDVYRRLRGEIIRGELRPNEPLVETDLAARLAVSRTPVRESLHKLAADGMIVSRRRRWFVYEHSRAEIREIYDIRAALEGYAARLACLRGNDEQIGALMAAKAELAGSNSANDGVGDDQVVHNERFHDLVVAAAGNERLTALVQRNRLYFFNYRIASLYTAADVAEYHRQHLALLEAIGARDADRAERLTREHVDHALELIVTRLY